MIPYSRAVAAIAIVLAAATHCLALMDFDPHPTAQIEGGGSAEPAAFGSSFKDFTAGTMPSTPETARIPTVEPDQQIEQADPEVQTPRATKPLAKQVMPTLTGAIKATQPQNPSPPEPTHAKRVETNSASKPVTQPVRDSTREEKKTAQPAAKAGNAERSQKKGSATGETRKAEAATGKATRAASTQGNADASNYAGKVKRKILRAKRKSVKIRGTVLVTFRIADSGELLSANIARSSGSKRLDQIALSQVRAAAPFPNPPASARREYTIEIVSK